MRKQTTHGRKLFWAGSSRRINGFKGPRPLILGLCSLGLGVSLTGCGGGLLSSEARQANPAACPEALVLQDAARFIEFNGEENLENIAFTGEILKVSTVCRYYGDKPIEAEVILNFAFGRGPAAQNRTTEIGYFVTVTRRDSDLIAKEEFSIPVKFGKVGKDGLAQINITEKISDIVIPRKDSNVAGRNFEIIVGLVLTKDQLIFNRNGTSLKFPDL